MQFVYCVELSWSLHFAQLPDFCGKSSLLFSHEKIEVMFEDLAFWLLLVGPKFLIVKNSHSIYSVCLVVLLEVIDALYAMGFTTEHMGLIV